MLELRKITKDYEVGEEKVHALKGVSLAFRKNEMVSILGQSGCGKTTLLNIIGGLDRYTDGDLIINDRSTKYFKASDWDAYRNQKIGFVFQSYNLIPHLTVLGNVELALTLSGIKKSERRERAIDALKKVGLESEIKKRPNQMSGGQMQRVAIARAIVNDPDIILADEPTGALDSTTSVAVMDILKDIAKDRLVIMVTHNRDLAEKYSTRIISMLDGEVVDDTSPVAVTESETNASSALGDGDIALEAEPNKATAAADEKQLIKQRKKEQKAITKANRAALKRTSMSFWTAFGLSWRNLITKKGRTIATAVAGSIGIIGVALVLALSNGFNGYIEDMQTSMLAHYPVTATQLTVNVEETMENMNSMGVKLEKFPDGNKLIVKDDSTMAAYHFNRITPEFLEHLDNMPEGLAIDITRDYAKTKIILSAHTENGYGVIDTTSDSMSAMIGSSSSGVKTLLNNSDYVLSQYDVLQGKYPTEADEVAVIVGSDNSLNRSMFSTVGLKIPDDPDNATFDDLIGQEYKLVYNDQWFTYNPAADLYLSFDNLNPTQSDWETLYNNDKNLTLKVVGVMRIKDSAALAIFGSGLVVTPKLNDVLIENSMQSAVAKAQTASPKRCVSDALKIGMGSSPAMNCAGAEFSRIAENMTRFGMAMREQDALDMALQAVGASDIPNAINFYPVTFSKKSDMIDYIAKYNSARDKADGICTLDAASVVTDTVSDMIDIISYVLVAFAAISLVVSSVMISIITYASVVERIKEIGVLRAVGARKMDIMRVFNAETVIIGLAAGIIGVLVTLILSFPLSSLFIAISDGMVAVSLVVVSWWHAVVLIAVSVVLTLIAGMLPAMSAAKRDPVVALRSE